MSRYLLAALLVLGVNASRPTPARTFHHCTYIGWSGNTPHLFDTSEVYKCDEGKIEIAGRSEQTIEYGYVFSSELGRPSCTEPYKATDADYNSAKWCDTPQPWDPSMKKRCGDKQGMCRDGKLATWDPKWRGYSCMTPDHDGK